VDIERLYLPFYRLFRTRRMRRFWDCFGLTADTRVLDIGGGQLNWSLLPTSPHLVLLNLSPLKSRSTTVRIVTDGRHLPFRDGAIDVAYSNSVVEHLGDSRSQQVFAGEVRRVARRYYVQTRNRWFPIEPHFLTPFVHFLPKPIQKHLLRSFTIRGLLARPTSGHRDRLLQGLRLLDERELRRLFPDAEVWHERVLGLTESLIAVRL